MPELKVKTVDVLEDGTVVAFVKGSKKPLTVKPFDGVPATKKFYKAVEAGLESRGKSCIRVYENDFGRTARFIQPKRSERKVKKSYSK